MKIIDNLGLSDQDCMSLDIRMNINLPLLRQQKMTLCELQWEFIKAGDERADHLAGVLAFLDAVEDALDPPTPRGKP